VAAVVIVLVIVVVVGVVKTKRMVRGEGKWNGKKRTSRMVVVVVVIAAIENNNQIYNIKEIMLDIHTLTLIVTVVLD
jgi:hypothetical protein